MHCNLIGSSAYERSYMRLLSECGPLANETSKSSRIRNIGTVFNIPQQNDKPSYTFWHGNLKLIQDLNHFTIQTAVKINNTL